MMTKDNPVCRDAALGDTGDVDLITYAKRDRVALISLGATPYDIQRNQWLLLAEAVPGDGDAEWYPEVTLAQFHAGKDSYDVLERPLSCVLQVVTREQRI